MIRLSALPNILSSLRIFLTPFFVIFLLQGEWWLIVSLIIFTLAALTDTFDGYYARRFEAYTFWGAFLDPIADKVLINTALGVFAYLHLVSWWVVGIIILRDLLVTVLRLQKISHGTVLQTSFIAKFKTTAQFISIYFLFICLIMEWLHVSHVWIYGVTCIANIFLYIVAGLTLYSGLSYVWK